MLFKKTILHTVCVLFVLVIFLDFVSHVQAQDDKQSAFKFSGDFRLRYENTSNQILGPPLPDNEDARNRQVIRLRAAATKQVNDMIKVGARLTTGSSDDPNSTDVTLGSFVNDLQVSLDRLYAEFRNKGLFLTGGKFPNPFRRTDLVWDGDVNPQGLAARYTFQNTGQITPTFTGSYLIVDEQTLAKDSYMWGGQAAFSINTESDVKVSLAVGYFDYTLAGLSAAGPGDTRTNILTPGRSAYVSDFDLLDIIAQIDLPGFNERYPIRIVGDYVKNLGAKVNQDKGFAFDVFFGKTSKKKDVRFRYGYAQLETDAVLTAFSHDNTTIASNYKQHTVTIDYVALDNTILNLTWYLHKRKELPFGDTDDDFVSRLRLNALVRL